MVRFEIVLHWHVRIHFNGSYMRSWYVCSCGCVMSSKTWRRFKGQLVTTGQRWYCRAVWCGKRYKVVMGQLMECNFDGTHYWSLASIPPADVEDLRARSLELSTSYSTPQALFEGLEKFKPLMSESTAEMIRPALASEVDSPTEEELPYIFFLTEMGRQLLSQQPLFSWEQLATFVAGLEDKP